MVREVKFSFKDLLNTEMYKSAKVLFVFGQYNIFNNIAIDNIKEICKPIVPTIVDSTLLDDFDLGDVKDRSVINSVSLDTFSKVVYSASMSGLWFTSVNYSFISKKQKEWIDSYIKLPYEHGRLVVYCNEYKDYRALLKNRVILNSNSVHMIQLGYPYGEILNRVVEGIFYSKGVSIEQSAVELFVMRMSSSYDNYEEIIDRIISQVVPAGFTEHTEKESKYIINYSDTLSALKGIENFVIDDFVEKLAEPLRSDKPNTRNKIFKMWASLSEEFGPMQLVSKLRYKIEDYIEFRLAINLGIIPVKVRFSVPEAKGRLGEQSRLVRFSDYTFRKMALRASKTSLKDWEYMKLILSKAGYTKESNEKVIYSLINRAVLAESRIASDIFLGELDYGYSVQLSKIAYQQNTEEEEVLC